MLVIADLCNCEYTDHGHCGILDANGDVDNDATVELLVHTALTYAQAGVDVVAPSDMMDGRVGAIRGALDARGFIKHARSWRTREVRLGFYGPFREAADSTPQFRRPPHLSDGPAERARSVARGRARHRRRRRHRDGQAGARVHGLVPAPRANASTCRSPCTTSAASTRWSKPPRRRLDRRRTRRRRDADRLRARRRRHHHHLLRQRLRSYGMPDRTSLGQLAIVLLAGGGRRASRANSSPRSAASRCWRVSSGNALDRLAGLRRRQRALSPEVQALLDAPVLRDRWPGARSALGLGLADERDRRRRASSRSRATRRASTQRSSTSSAAVCEPGDEAVVPHRTTGARRAAGRPLRPRGGPAARRSPRCSGRAGGADARPDRAPRAHASCPSPANVFSNVNTPRRLARRSESAMNCERSIAAFARAKTRYCRRRELAGARVQAPSAARRSS